MPSTVYDHISRNNWKILFLVLMFPAVLCGLLYGGFLLITMDSPRQIEIANELFLEVVPIAIGVVVIWTAFSYWWGDKMMLGFAHAQKMPDTIQYRPVRHAVENCALAAGLPCPRIYLVDDDSLNAFATGHSPQTASIALTTGIIDKLEPLELQGVIAHEMAHIGNRDVRLNMIIIIGLGIVGLLGEILLRSVAHSGRRRSNKGGGAVGVVLLIGIVFLIFSWFLAPFIRLAISRTQEYNADATGAFITRNPKALASALRKISADPRVEILDSSPTMAAVCICNPLKKAHSLLATHPSVESRIYRLERM